MFLMLSLAETIIGVNEASSSGKGFSLFLLWIYHYVPDQKRSLDFLLRCLSHYLMSLIVLRQLFFAQFEVSCV